MPQPCNLDGIYMNIQEENSAHYFQVQRELEQTLLSMHSNATRLPVAPEQVALRNLTRPFLSLPWRGKGSGYARLPITPHANGELLLNPHIHILSQFATILCGLQTGNGIALTFPRLKAGSQYTIVPFAS